MTALMMNAGAQDISFDGLQTGMARIKAAAAAPAPAPVPAVKTRTAPQSRPAVEREWLVLVFINGRNDLWRNAIKDVNEMELVGSTDKVAVTVELGLLQDRGDSSRLYIQKDASGGADDTSSGIVSPAVKVSASDMGSWKHFVDFARWSYGKYPAKKVMAVVWGHGSGRVDIGGADNAGAEFGISPDNLTRNFIRNRQLAQALGEIEKSIGKKVSVYASDACLMQMASVAYEIKDGADMIVGAEEAVPGMGFPYNAILRDLAADPGMNPGTLSSVIVDEFSASYSATGAGTAISALKTSELPEFVRLLNDWVRAAAVPAHRTKLLDAERETLSFEKGYSGNDTADRTGSKDLYDFVDLAGKKAGRGSGLYARGEILKNFITGRLVTHSRATPPGSDYDRAKGLAIYFPKMIYDQSYDETLFSRDSLWDDFLKWKLDRSYKMK